MAKGNQIIPGKSPVMSLIFRKILQPRIVKLMLVVLAVINVAYFSFYLLNSNTNQQLKSKFKNQASIVLDSFYPSNNKSPPKQEDHIHNIVTVDYSSSKTNPGVEEVHNDLPKKEKPNPLAQKLYSVPDKPYEELTDKEKILHRLNEITLNKEQYWLAHTELTDSLLTITIKDFLSDQWVDNPTLFYDPRFTLTLYLYEIREQYLQKNPNNEKSKLGEIVVPFAWSDWVDLTLLNEEFTKEQNDRVSCSFLKETHHIPAKNPDYCIDIQDISDEDLAIMGLPSKEFVPGFAIKESPTNKASNEVRMLEGKGHLLTYAKNPYKIIFLSKDGVYEAQVEGKQRIVDSDLFDKYLMGKNIQNFEAKLVLDPVKEFNEFRDKVKPNPIDPNDDVYGMVAKLKDANPSHSKEIYITEEDFNYQQDKIDSQIADYEARLAKLKEITTNELLFNEQSLIENKLSRNELNYYNGLKYADKFPRKKEETYFRMARLNFDKNDKNHDAGWHYEWRFFNGAMRYLKKGWNREELIVRDKILLDRILRNWFRFANEKGIISWIAHGPLLSWYWDGLLFPFDEDIDIQMPILELTRLSKNYNQTLVVEDITEGFGKYLIDCSTFLHHRGKTNKQNHIDARFIDIDTGSYIDITGLSISEDEPPERYNEIIQKAESEGKLRPVYNCRNSHFTSYNEIVPLRFSMMGGVPLYVPNQIENILIDEYHEGINAYVYGGYYFVDAMNLWIHGSNLTFLFEEDLMIKQDYKNSDGTLDEEKFTKLVQEMDDSKVLKLIENNEDILLEYYLTKDVTDLHKQELAFMFEALNGADSKMHEVSHQLPEQQISGNLEYHKFVGENFNFQKPFRRPLFNYEYIDRPLHHKEPTDI